MALAILAIACALAGCLFPSFDDLEGPSARADDVSTSPGSAPSANANARADAGGAGSGAGATSAKVIACGNAFCAVGVEYCCDGIMSGCVPEGRSDCIFAEKQHCDGNEDCPAGESCCANATDPDVVCRAGCQGQIRCNAASTCPSGTTCKVALDGVTHACL